MNNLYRLEDNKVEQWSAKYLDYEKLKAILKKAKASAANVEELKKKLPRELVEGSFREFTARKAQEKNTRKFLEEQLKQQSGERGSDKPNQIDSTQHFELVSRSSSSLPGLDELQKPTDLTPLLVERRTSFGSNSEHSTGASMSRQNSWGNFSNTVFKVTSYLGLADDRQIFFKSLEDADDKLHIFTMTYDEEVRKVKDFYQDKLDELSEHIEAIIESVDTSHIKQYPKKARRGSMLNDLVLKFENVMHSKKGYGALRGVDNIPPIHTSASGDSDDVVLDTENPITKLRNQSSSNKLDLERESDSIKRALTDVYRNAKMLHNYSIMNYTGFVKIAKKFDKTLPDHKGAFKNNICEDGMQAEVLAAKIVSVKNSCISLTDYKSIFVFPMCNIFLSTLMKGADVLKMVQ